MGGQKAISKHTVSLVKNEKKLIGKHVVKPRGEKYLKRSVGMFGIQVCKH